MRQLYEYHDVIGYRFIPGLKARIPHEGGGFLVAVNNSGFRCRHEFTKDQLTDGKRLLLFGDSFTAGDSVSNKQRYGDLLEDRLQNLQVYNYGLPGSGTDQHYLIFREFAKEVHADAIVVAVLVENIRRVNSRYRLYDDEHGKPRIFAKPYYDLVGDELVLGHSPVPRQPFNEEDLPADAQGTIDRGGRFETLRKVVNAVGVKELVQRWTGYQPVPEYNDPNGSTWRLMRAILARWIRECHTPVILMPLPLYQFVEETSDPSAYQQRFRELAGDCGCTLHDPLPDLWKYSLKERREFRFKSDIHPTPAYHAALADSLKPTIRRVLGIGS